MSPRTFAYIFSLTFGTCLLPEAARAQEQVVPDTTARRFIPTGVRIGTDLIGIARGQFTNDFDGWEIAADVDFYRYYLVAEYGRWSVYDSISNGLYTNDGNYFRIGVDVNFLTKDPDKNMFFLGGRFGRSSFTDQAMYSYGAPEFDEYTVTVTNPNVVGTWVELTTGLKVRIWSFLWLGATGRLKFGLDLDGNGALTSYDVPGFGRNIKSSWWGINYYVLVRMPFSGRK